MLFDGFLVVYKTIPDSAGELGVSYYVIAGLIFLLFYLWAKRAAFVMSVEADENELIIFSALSALEETIGSLLRFFTLYLFPESLRTQYPSHLSHINSYNLPFKVCYCLAIKLIGRRW